MAPIDMSGTWKNVKNENLENFFKALNLDIGVRTMAMAQKPVIEINQDGEVFRILTEGIKTVESNFTVGQEYTDINPLDDNEPSTYLAVWDGDKLRTENKSHPHAIHFDRELVDGQLVQTLTSGTGDKAVVCKRIFDKE
ncbi:retinol-binding protein 1-like [Patiria miniata]|uniref:Lipocalin/cytosolic fatty-acid binding domain-containing protein n=1 Tax=Patiria miniata TaxID=46514 RepID=A0A914A518_PATMI|nr:retinol-binding protein 1-like [Patiria miniata]